MRIVFCLMLLFAIARPSLSMPNTRARYVDEKAVILLKQVEATIAKADTLTAELSGTVRDQRPERVPLTTYTGTLRLMRPNFAWIDYQESSKKGDAASDGIQTLIVSTGKNLWRLDSQKNEYRQSTARPDGANIPGIADALPIGMPLYMFFASRAPHTDAPPTYAGTETWDGKPYQIVEFRDGETAQNDPPMIRQRLYIGSDYLIHRIVNEQLKGKYIVEWELRNIQTNTAMTASDFAYVPPARAKNVATPSPSLLAAGTASPDFTVEDRDGKPLKLSDFRGRVVVLDFWSTGCGHSLESREHLNAVARKFGDGVVVLSVHVWDRKEAFQAWLPKHPQFDALRFAVDSSAVGKDVARALYQVPGLPAHFVIDRDGKIVKGFLGYDGPTPELENTIKAAGGKVR